MIFIVQKPSQLFGLAGLLKRADSPPVCNPSMILRVESVKVCQSHKWEAWLMATYAVSFDIKYDKTYSDRYSSLMDEIGKCSRVWDETTSFCLCETAETPEAFERKLFLSNFNTITDKMLVMDVRYDDAIARGKIDYPATLRSLLPSVDVK